MKALGILFSNIHDDGLRELTRHRTTASVPYGGRYRLIDFMLSNMVNADISNIAIITKTNYHSLMDHIESGKAWDLSRKSGGISIFPPYSTNSLKSVYRGKLEALLGIKKFLDNAKEDYVVLGDCHVICALDMKNILKQHLGSKADITAVYHERDHVTHEDVILTLDENQKATDVSIAYEPKQQKANVSLGVYVMEKNILINIIEEAYGHGIIHLEREYLPKHLHKIHLNGYQHHGYSTAIHSVQDFFGANMDLLDPRVRDELFYVENIYTKVKDTPPTRYGTHATVKNSFVADGAIIDGFVENSIIFRNVEIGMGAVIKNSIIMQSTTIESNAQLNYVITDKNVIITRGQTLFGALKNPVVIPKDQEV